VGSRDTALYPVLTAFHGYLRSRHHCAAAGEPALNSNPIYLFTITIVDVFSLAVSTYIISVRKMIASMTNRSDRNTCPIKRICCCGELS